MYEKKRYAQINIWFWSAIISILLIADAITNWIMLIIADREIANVSARVSLIFSILFLVCAVVQIVLQIIIHINYTRDSNSEDSICIIVLFSVLFVIIGALLIVRTLGWFNQLSLQVLFPTHGLITSLSIFYGFCACFAIHEVNDFYPYYKKYEK